MILDLQNEIINLADSRCLLDTVPENFLEMRSRMLEEAKIVANTNVENAIYKILNKIFEQMSRMERESVVALVAPTRSVENLFVGERGFKRSKITHFGSKYMDVRFIRPTSNMYERLFSTAEYALNDHHKNVLPLNFDHQI